jgi:hypothetical protein
MVCLDQTVGYSESEVHIGYFFPGFGAVQIARLLV